MKILHTTGALGVFICSSLLMLPASFFANTPPTPSFKHETAANPSWPVARGADTNAISAIIRAFYEAISVKAGQSIHLVQLQSLFVPDGRIAILIHAKPGRAADIVFLTPKEYAGFSDSMTETQGFSDRILANQTERFGSMAHVESTFESRASINDKYAMAHGVKSIDLLCSSGRWYIVQVFYKSEKSTVPLPAWLLESHTD